MNLQRNHMAYIFIIRWSVSNTCFLRRVVFT